MFARDIRLATRVKSYSSLGLWILKLVIRKLQQCMITDSDSVLCKNVFIMGIRALISYWPRIEHFRRTFSVIIALIVTWSIFEVLKSWKTQILIFYRVKIDIPDHSALFCCKKTINNFKLSATRNSSPCFSYP